MKKLAPARDPRSGPVHHGAGQQRDERLDLADRRRPQHDDPGRPARDHRLHARDGGLHARRRAARRHLGSQPRLRDRALRLRDRLADDGAEPEPAGAAHRLVARRGPRRRARHPCDRRAHRQPLRGEGPGDRVRADRRRRRRRDRRGAADRRLGHDEVQLALGLRRRVRGRRHRPPRARDCSSRLRRAKTVPKLDLVGAALSAARARTRRLRRPQEQHLGLDRAAQPAVHRRPRAHAARLLGRPVPDPRRVRRPLRVRPLGAAPRGAGQGRAARPLAPADPAAARRARDPCDPAARPHGDVLRPPRLSPGGARPGRLRDGEEAVPDVDHDAPRGALRAAARSALRAAPGRPVRPACDRRGRCAPRRDDRRRSRRVELRLLARRVRRRRRAPDLAARQRDHVVRRRCADERGRRPAGHGPEPRAPRSEPR